MSGSVRRYASIPLSKRLAAGVVLAAMRFYSVAAQPGDPVMRKTFAESKPGTVPAPPIAKGALNVIWILLDDVGYGATRWSALRRLVRSAFGRDGRNPLRFFSLRPGSVRCGAGSSG